MQLQKQYQQDLVVITLNVDFDSPAGTPNAELRDKVSQTLRSLNVTCANRICSTPLEDVLESLELFGLPAAILYNREGQIARRFDGQVDLEGAVATEIDTIRVSQSLN